MSTTTTTTESGASATTNQSLYLGLGVGVGGLLLVAIIAIIIQIVRKTRQHSRRSAQLLEAGEITNVTTEIRRSSDIRRTLSIGRRATVQLSNEKAPWNPLASTETLETPAPTKKKLRSIRLPKRSKKNDVQLKSLKHLSAIAESPRSRAGQSPIVPEVEHHEMRMEHSSWPVMLDKAVNAAHAASNLSIVQQSDYSQQCSSQLHAVDEDDRPKPPRSVSMGALIGTTFSEPLLTPSLSVRRLKHARSASLGDKPPEHLPPDPVPSLPVISPHRTNNEAHEQPRNSMSSLSSDVSASSSVLISSPSFRRHASPNQTAKPGMLPVGSSPRASVHTPFVFPRIQHHIESEPNPLRISMPDGKRVLASLDSNSSLDQENKLTHTSSTSSRAKRAKISPSGLNRASIRKVSRNSVSIDGSPAERKKVGVLRDISGNASMASRRSSNGTQHSPNSSEGNPFQWDPIQVQKPSAMKGSPNARKGHRRVNCVRISTLTPQVLGPPPSRPESPSITHRIDEESSTDENGRTTFVTNRRPSRPSSTLGIGSQLRVQALRASYTPSSPTLSSWTSFQDPNLPSQPSDSHLTTSSGGFSRPLSGVSSNFSIPSFPSPSRITMTEVQRSEPVPEFCVSTPALEDDRAPSPLDPFSASTMHLSSSPPSPLSAMYEPAWITNNSEAPASSGASLRDLSPSIPRPSPLFREKLTSGNASSVMATLPSELFPGAPVLRPTGDSAAIEGSDAFERPITPLRQQDLVAQGVVINRSPHRDISPNGPRQEPGRSVYKTAMALRRMNSEIDTTNCRESRRWLQFGREPSPQLGFFPSPNPSEESNEVFDFGFDRASPAGDTVTMSSPSVRTDSATKRLSSQKTYPRSILKNKKAEENVWNGSPLAIRVLQGSIGVQKKDGTTTPNSLYDADGFLR